MKDSPKYSTSNQNTSVSEKSLFLINDNHNTLEHVIDCLVAICDHSELQAEQCAIITHYKGRCEIAFGNSKDLIALHEDLSLYGLDVEIF